MYYRVCEICGLRSGRENNRKRTFMAQFPPDEERCKKWVKVTGKINLVYVPIEKLHESKFVCGNHFEQKCFNQKKTHLKRDAVPSLDLKLEPLPDDILVEFPLHESNERPPTKSICIELNNCLLPTGFQSDELTLRKFIHMDHDYCLPPIGSQSDDLTSTKCIHLEHDYCLPPIGSQMPTSSNVQKRKREQSPINTVVKREERIDQKRLRSPEPTSSNVQSNKRKRERSPINTVVNREERIGQKTLRSPEPTSSNVQSNKRKRERSPINTVVNREERIGQKRLRSPDFSKLEVGIQKKKKKRELSPKPSTSTAVKEMSPQKRRLVKQLFKSKEKLKVLQKEIQKIEKLKISSPVLKSLIDSTIHNQKRKAKGRRWNKINKSIALAIYKKSPKAYRYLSQLIPMPSVRTLQIVLEKIQITPGIDRTVISYLKNRAVNLSEKDKICVLLFDEMAVNKRLIYNASTDQVDGYQDLGDEGGRADKIANHAMVFMLQGLHKKIKQPIAHYFASGGVPTEKLAVIIKNIIRAVTAAGYKVLSTVCDQGPTNVGAINLLKKFCGNPSDSNHFLVDDEKVFIIFDVPHLFKSIRNNFFEAGELVMNNKKAKWRHLLQLVEKNNSTLHFTKITKAHVDLKYRSKMRVKLASQLLSNTVAAILKLLAESVENEENSEEILESAQIIEDLDKLFDCTNGPGSPKDVKKNYRTNVTKNSFHHKRWTEYKKKLKTLHFLKSDSVLRLKNVRCVNGYITTISSLQDIWKYMASKKIKYLNLRQCNQDSLENLFGLIRQHSPTNKNPTCHHFTSALKSSILTRLSTPLSRGTNCEKDYNEILFDFHDIVFPNETGHQPEQSNPNQEIISADDNIPVFHIPDDEEEDEDEIEKHLMNFDKQATVYVSGYLAQKLLKNTTCSNCVSSLKVEDPAWNPLYRYIQLREWWEKRSLTYPTFQLCDAVDTATKIFDAQIKPRLFEKDICQASITAMLAGSRLSWICTDHKDIMTHHMLQRLSQLLIRNECKIKNNSFASIDEQLESSVKRAQQL